MTPKARAMQDLQDAIKRMGWDVSLHDSGDGLVAGTAGYVARVTGALVGAALHGIGGGVLTEETPEDQPADKVCPPGSGEPETGQDGATGAVCECAESADSPRLDTPVQANGYPAGLGGKVAGQILGAIDGKPVGMLSQAPEEG